MSDNACPKEDRIREALARGESSPEISAHLAACPRCLETAAVVSAMKRIGNEAGGRFATEARIPDAAALQRRARALRASVIAGTDEILKPLRAYRRFVLPLGLAAGLLTAVLNAASLKSLLLSPTGLSSLADGLRSISTGSQGRLFLLAAVFGGLGLMVLIVLSAFWGNKPEKT
ncbi:MAG: hypothetical protein JW843_03140 [Candidatus Aminicenantes bacterium]|nr:hypothetical protein [Candidatus Aminicenantes bacterium]